MGKANCTFESYTHVWITCQYLLTVTSRYQNNKKDKPKLHWRLFSSVQHAEISRWDQCCRSKFSLTIHNYKLNVCLLTGQFDATSLTFPYVYHIYALLFPSSQRQLPPYCCSIVPTSPLPPSITSHSQPHTCHSSAFNNLI